MVLEIVSSRFFAPYIGTSLTVWTSLIGVVLMGLSVGYAIGGHLGDQWRSLRRLRGITAMAGLWVLLLTVIRDPVLVGLTEVLSSLMQVAVLGAFLLLVVPSALLGAVSPYAVRLATCDVAHVGRTAGFLSALSAIGSIAGVFLTGFVLIPAFGTDGILMTTGIALLLTALLPLTRRSASLSCAVLLFLTSIVWLRGTQRAATAQGVLRSIDSPYSVLRVRRMRGHPSARDVLLLEVDGGSHAAIYADESGTPGTPPEHVFHYTPYYRLVDAVRTDVDRGLLLGGGGYTVARDFLAQHPRASLDVVEIDPGVTAMAREYFHLPSDGRMTIHHEDARTFLNRGGPPEAPGGGRGRYHVVFGDAFRSLMTIPFHLTTHEAAERISSLLDDRGLYLVNVIAAREGPRSAILHAMIRTLRQSFPTVLVFEVPVEQEAFQDDPLWYRNFLLLASRVSLASSDLHARGREDLRQMLGHRLEEPVDLASVPVLTDDYAPVEAMLNL